MIVQELKAMVEAYLSENKTRTIHTLAKKSHVSYSALRRIMQEEVKQVSFEVALGLLKNVADKEKQVDVIKKYFPNVGSIMEANVKYLYVEDSDQLKNSIDTYESFSTFALVNGKRNGIYLHNLKKIMGDSIEYTVQQMEAEDLLKISNDEKIEANIDRYSTNDFQSTSVRLGFCQRHLKKSLVGKNKQFLGVLTEGINDAGQKKLYDLYTKFYHEVAEILDNNPGENVVFANLALGEIG